MPVIRCSNGKYRIGDGPCVYKSKAAAERAYAAYRAQTNEAVLVKEKTKMAEPKLSKKELRMVLDAKIRRSAAWAMRGAFGDTSKVATEVYDGIVADLMYNDSLLKATRSVRGFSKKYVQRVIDAAAQDGTLQPVAEAMAYTEKRVQEMCGCCGKDHDKKRKKGKK